MEALNREQLIVNGALGDGLVREASRKKGKLELGRKKLKIIRVCRKGITCSRNNVGKGTEVR